MKAATARTHHGPMRSVTIEPSFESWRDAARRLLAAGVSADAVLWSETTGHESLFPQETNMPLAGNVPRVSAAFLDMARTVAAHRDPRRWALLYRVLWRIQHGERRLMENATDPDMRQLQNWAKAVGRDIHKMHAFVRFRQVDTGETGGREQFVAWFEPGHRIVRLAAPFFRKRFAAMDWSILTPDECVHWDGRELAFTPGVTRDAAPDGDALDELWRTYYRSIFNPARLKTRMMQSEMPKKYWKNLPEAPLIGELVAESGRRVRDMLDAERRPVKPAPNNAYLQSLLERNRRNES
jgi:probable DNA metabolism protein